MLSVENVSYDLMLISLAKQLGAEVAVEFAEFVVASGDHFAIQKKYEEILKNHLTNNKIYVIIYM